MLKKKIIAPIVALLIPLSVHAQDLGGNMLNTAAGSKGAGYKSGVQIEDVIGTVVNAVLALLGVIFLTLIIYGGYMWMTAGGDEGKVEKAKYTISRSIIGLVIVLAAYAITFFVLDKVIQATIR